MGKKRKASGHSTHTRGDGQREAPAIDSKLQVNNYEDVADSEDEFHINRDKILLEEGPAQKRQRRAKEEDAFLEFSDEEVLAASPSIPESEDPDDETDDELEPPKTQSKLPKVASDGLHDSDSEASRVQSEDPDLGGWGNSKKDYYDADVIETEADALGEEAEARRLQQKQLQGMTEADFGFDEAEWLDAGKGADEDDEDDEDGTKRAITEVLPQLEITDEMSVEERMKILRTRYPEFEPLAKEFLELQEGHEDLRLAAEEAQAVQKYTTAQNNETSTMNTPFQKPPIPVLKLRALSTYLASLCMYFALLTSSSSRTSKSTAMAPSELRDHPIMDSLMRTRTLWSKVSDLAIPSPSSSTISFLPLPNNNSNSRDRTSNTATNEPTAPPRKPRKRKSRADKIAAAALAAADARRADRLAQTEASLASLSSLAQPSTKPPKKASAKTTAPGSDNSGSDLGDPTTLPAHEAVQKSALKKSLKFYTSQIASKSQKREAASRDAGGDADLPYKERLRERQERLTAMAEKRGRKDADKGEELGGEVEEADLEAARAIREEGAAEGGYYDLISSKAAAKKAEKAARAASENQIVRIEDEEGGEGKRKVSYAIEKNKGLAPKRKKEVRNPRVKKRRKYEEKKKKLGSVRQVYKGGEGRGYAGEKTGIKGGLVRSVKL